MKTITINVTKRDIERGQRCNSSSCPIALATRRKFKQPVDVGPLGFLVVGVPGHRYYLPNKAMNFIRNFDYREPVKPFKFKV